MTPPPLSTRQAAVEAAVHLLREGDLTALSMRAVAERTGVSATALYRHFADRAELLGLALRELQSRFRDGLERGLSRPDPGERLLGVLLAARDFGLDHPGHFKILFLTQIPGVRPPVYPGGFKPPRRDLANLVTVVEECMAGGLLAPDDPVDVALLLVATVQGLMRFWLLGRFGDDRDEFEQFYERSITRMLAGPGRSNASD